jgi:ABC-type Fe3+-hydroxamate transport system substrate-binding protein
LISMAIVSPRRLFRESGATGRFLMAGLGFCCLALLAGCGAGASASPGTNASASATPTCPPVANFKSVSGAISATGNNTITVTPASGAPVVVQLTSSTRITKQVTVSPTSITNGTNVLIISDTNATTAQRIAVFSGAGGGFGGFGRGGFGGGSGTPGAFRNSACFQRTPGAGRGGFGGGSATGAFQGLRGTVASVTSNQIIINDPQGQTFSLAITPSTVITSTASGTAADLVQGVKVTATGTLSGSQIKANSVAVTSAS